MGHIRKQGENTWEITISTGKDPVTGKYGRIYETVQGNKTQAKKRMMELEYELEHSTYIKPSELTLSELLHQWYQDYAQTNLAPSTQEYYDIIINSHIIPLLGGIKISDLEPMHIQRYLSEKLRNGRLDGKSGGLSNKSVKRHYTVINQVLKYAAKLQVIENNPAKYVDPPKPENPEIQALKQEELEKILDIAKGWIHDFIYIAAFTGMRRGELLALRWKDVNFKDKSLQIRQSVSKLSGGRLIYREPKTKSSIRLISIDDDIVKILKCRNKEQKENKLKLGSQYNNKYNLVFAKENGDPYLPLYTTRQFNKVAEKANLSNFRLHDLRHTHATLMLQAGIHPKIVQERLGHSSITQTLDTYSHITPSMQRTAVQKLKDSLKK
ncbi:tyrosine-type recombinase/integrase [Orenia marismortui]|uniref:tyrosine-type recombinase/integrase n=1 Tax=Orenia marismortui TaxID=46469 RepID=UPI00036B84C2|nr:site-specific integrase [Orenia marismortui]